MEALLRLEEFRVSHLLLGGNLRDEPLHVCQMELLGMLQSSSQGG